MLDLQTQDLIVTEKVGVVTVIRINRPSKYNALTQEMYARFSQALVEADDNPSVRSIVITGTGEAFTAGNDLGDLAIAADGDTPVQEFLRTIASVRTPLIVAVNGLAVGVGVTMLLHCDLVYVDPTATFQAPFVDVGLVPEAASTLLLPQLIGARRATEMLLVGRKLIAEEAASWGLVNEVTLDPLGHAIAVAQVVGAKAPQAVRRTKELMRSTSAEVLAHMREEDLLQVSQLGSAEFAEIVASRREKRSPQF